MKSILVTTMLLAFADAGALAVSPAAAQEAAEMDIAKYTCKDVMRDANHDVAIAFLHGYLLGKANATKFDIETIEKQTDQFVDQCLDNPQAKAMDVMVKIKGQ